MAVRTLRKSDLDPAAIVAEAQEIHAALRRFDDPRARRLSAAAFVRESLKIAGILETRAVELRQIFEADAGRHYAETWRFLVSPLGLVTWIGDGRMSAPTADKRRLLLPASVQAELASLGAKPFDLQAVAALMAADRHPEAFGEMTGLGDLQTQIADLNERLQALREPLLKAREYLQAEIANVDAALTQVGG